MTRAIMQMTHRYSRYQKLKIPHLVLPYVQSAHNVTVRDRTSTRK